ncbi:MAG: hypothetical protein WCE52_15370 [Candidatus Acidiferrum sp.]
MSERAKSVNSPVNAASQIQAKDPENRVGADHRGFLNRLGGATALVATAGSLDLSLLAKPASAITGEDGGERGRARDSHDIRVDAARREEQVPVPEQTNGDEHRHSSFIGNFSKGLPHNSIGEVDPAAYELFRDACHDGTTTAFESVALGGTVKLVNPIAGMAFDLEGTDSHQLAIGPPPALASQTRADDMVELYWMALCRDVNFTDYDTA